jgi:uncharacterized protein (DUF1499 family)
MRLAAFGPAAALALSSTALCLLAVAPFGWRLGWWHYGFGLYRLMPASAVLAVIAAALSILTVVQRWAELRPRALAMLAAAVALSAVLIYVPLQYSRTRSSLPAIHDISTDMAHPPVFKAVLPARAAEGANSLEARGAELARMQMSAYPDMRPLLTGLPLAAAFNEALNVAKSMPGWTIATAGIAADAGYIEASQSSRWFRFIDDVVIRITPCEGGSRIDMRSVSRHGHSDYGVNAARIRAYLSALQDRIS